jgi:DNA-binding response OmpR family regulator
MFDSALILVAETDDRLRTFTATELAADEANVREAADPAQAIARAAVYRPEAMLLGDLGSPRSAVEVIRAVRGSGGLRNEPSADLPIIALADPADELAVLRLFEAGADDVTDRSAGYPVLRARMLVLLGRAGSRTCTPTIRVGALEVSMATRQVWLRGTLVGLSAKEFALLSALLSEPTRVFTRQELLRDIWGFHSDARTRTLDSHACRLRGKLRADGDRFLVSVWGIGYRLIDAIPGQLEQAA